MKEQKSNDFNNNDITRAPVVERQARAAE